MSAISETRPQLVAPRPLSQRIGSVDVCRVIAIVAVICLHTNPFGQDRPLDHPVKWYLLNLFVDHFSRFAVPFFFSASGYFWGMKIRNGVSVAGASIPMAKRLGAIYAFWCLAYLLPYNITTIPALGLMGPIKLSYWKLLTLAHRPVPILFLGDALQLWFLPALLCSLGIAAFFIARREFKLLAVFSVALFTIGTLAGAYATTPIGLQLLIGKYAFPTRNGPFFGILFFGNYILDCLRLLFYI